MTQIRDNSREISEAEPPNPEVLDIAVDSADRELAFYRRRSGQIYLVSLSAEALLIVQKERIIIDQAPSWVSPLILSVAFAAVAVVGTVLGAEYRRRIHELKATRKSLFVSALGRDVHPESDRRRVSEIEVLYFVLWFTSGGGSFLAWLRAYPTSPSLGLLGGVYALSVLVVTYYGIRRSFGTADKRRAARRRNR